MEEKDKEHKRTSKLTSLIDLEADKFEGLQVTVYYSENNWETYEEVNLIVDENTTINQLIDMSLYKFKTELFYDNIDQKQFKVMLFKKKKKIPNYEYPICNPESEVKNYGKTHFCLVEDVNAKEEDPKQGNEDEANNNMNIDIRQNMINNDKSLNNNEINNEKNNKENKEIKGYKICGGKCLSCTIF